jgi:uncharacterized protein (DUF305 family)
VQLGSTCALALAIAAQAPANDQQTNQPSHDQQMSQHMAMAQHDMSEGSSALHQSMMKGMQDMQSMNMTGNTDQDFATMMIQHHQQAIEMARAQLDHGKDPEVRRAAQKIISDSQKDIDQLTKWRDQHASQSAGKTK